MTLTVQQLAGFALLVFIVGRFLSPF